MTPFTIGELVVTNDGSEGRVTDVYRRANWDSDEDVCDYVIVRLGCGCVIDVRVEEVRSNA